MHRDWEEEEGRETSTTAVALAIGKCSSLFLFIVLHDLLSKQFHTRLDLETLLRRIFKL